MRIQNDHSVYKKWEVRNGMKLGGTMSCGDRFYASRESGIGKVGGFRHGLAATLWLGVEMKYGRIVYS